MKNSWSDNDPIETQEWLEALDSLVREEGKERAQFILGELLLAAERLGVEGGSAKLVTPFVNTLALDQQPQYPGDLAIEAMLEAIIRWNAIAMVILGKEAAGGVGGHLSSLLPLRPCMK